jgi:protoporphyrinogen oxidase
MTQQRKTAAIIGAGPAGLTAALELIRRSDVRPIVFEASDTVGGISRTVNFNGYRMDIGGHRFFSKSDWVMDWWEQILPLEGSAAARGERISIAYQNQRRDVAPGRVSDDTERVMLVRDRLSRIYFLEKFFDYPLRLDMATIAKMGLLRFIKASISYARASLAPRRPELSLEDFLINRFGQELYGTFFKDYTEKVWGVPCAEISAEWGAQRIKGLSLTKAVMHALGRTVGSSRAQRRREVHTSLVERFLYPKYGPGQLWEEVAKQVDAEGGEISLSHTVERLCVSNCRVTQVESRDVGTGAIASIAVDYVISTMAVKDLVQSFDPPAPENVRRIAARLPYRDFITVGIVANRMKHRTAKLSSDGATLLPDNWIYIQDPEVRLGRLQIFNNWSPSLVSDPTKVSLGLEYFCNEGDDLWRLSDAEMQMLAVGELAKIGLLDANDVIAANVIRVPKAYPAYFGSYADFGEIRKHTDAIENLFLVGRNGMHRYNNQDHSMLTAKTAVDNMISGRLDKSNIWDINLDDEYHEEK